MSKTQFKMLDLGAFSLIGIVSECINIWAFRKFSGSFYISFAVVLGLIGMVRWGWWGLIITFLTGAASVVFQLLYEKATPSYSWALANTVGYLFLGFNLIFLKTMGKEKPAKSYLFMIMYVVTGFLETEIGRSLCYIGSDKSLGNVLIMFFAYDLINMALGILVYIIACKQKKFVYDMNTYLLELNRETAESNYRKEKDDYASLEVMADDISEVSDIALLDGGTLRETQRRKIDETYRKMEGKTTKYDKDREEMKKLAEKKRKPKD